MEARHYGRINKLAGFKAVCQSLELIKTLKFHTFSVTRVPLALMFLLTARFLSPVFLLYVFTRPLQALSICSPHIFFYKSK